MYKQLLENKKQTFSSILMVEGDFEEQLARINTEWVFWLREYYTTTDKVKPTEIPFYNTQQPTLFEDIANKRNLRGFNPSKPFFRIYDKAQTFKGSQLFIEIPSGYRFFSYQTGTNNLIIPKHIRRELNRLPEGMVIGIYSDMDFRIFSHLSLNEYRTKNSLKKVGLQLESLRRFTNKYNHIGCCEGFVINSEEDIKEFEQGLICNIFDNYYDLKFWRK